MRLHDLMRQFAIGLVLLLGLLPQAWSVDNVVYYHNDALGSPVAITDNTGQVLWREAYAPYGQRLLKEGGHNTLWYTGKSEDSELGLSYYGARWYDPELGRFHGIDPVDFQEGNLQSFNRYAYANNNPYRYTDQDGNSPIDLVFLAYDVGKLGVALYTGQGVGAALVDAGISGAALFSPVPGAGQAYKATRLAGKAADNVADVKNRTTVLGENMMERVIPFAEKTGMSTLPFGTTVNEWAKMTPKQRWKLNDGALRSRINEGDDFQSIGKDPLRNPALRQRFDLTGSEMLRLNERGIRVGTVSAPNVRSVIDLP